ncbi:MAG: sensor domain-containing diguanylate cyclase [Thermotogota bacterium]
MNLKLKNLILFLVSIFTFYLLKIDISDVNFLDAFFVILLTYASDNLKIYWLKNNRLVSNTVGFIFAFVLGPEYILISSLVLIFSRNKNKEIKRKIYRVLVYSSTYSLAALVSYGFSPLLSLFLFITISKIINSIIVDGINKFSLKLFIFEYLHFLTLIPYTYLYIEFSDSPFRYLFILVNFMFLVLYYSIIKSRNEKNQEIIQNKRLKKFNEITLDLSNVIKDFSLKSSNTKILDEIADIIHKKLGYSHVLISLFDFNNSTIKRVGQKGIENDVFERIKKQNVPISSITKFIDEKYRYRETYFIPRADRIEKEFLYQLRDNIDINSFEEDINIWDPNDLLLVVLRDGKNNLIGYISVDEPENNLRPSKEELNILSVFAQMVSLTLEHSQKFYEIKSIAERDGLTGLYNHSKLFVDLEAFQRQEEQICVAFFDLDNFKQINDSLGHFAGDKILQKVADIFQEHIRDDDIAYRYGGDEFVIIFRKTDEENALRIINRFYKYIKEIHKLLSFSAGVTCSNESKNYRKLLESADKKAYVSKNTGKGKIITKE